MDKIEVFIDNRRFEVELKSSFANSRLEVCVDGKTMIVTIPNRQQKPENWHCIEIDGHSLELDIDSELRWIKSVDGLHRVDIGKVGEQLARPASADGRVKAPIPGLISKVFVAQGQTVERGDALLILEAMKMENEISAPRNGLVSNLNVSEGQAVSLGEVMVLIE